MPIAQFIWPITKRPFLQAIAKAINDYASLPESSVESYGLNPASEIRGLADSDYLNGEMASPYFPRQRQRRYGLETRIKTRNHVFFIQQLSFRKLRAAREYYKQRMAHTMG